MNSFLFILPYLLLLITPFITITKLAFGFCAQIDPVISITYCLSGIISLVLYKISKKHPYLLEQIFGKPMVWGMLLLSIVAFPQSFFLKKFLQNWFGTPQIGEGVLLFLSQAIFGSFTYIVLRLSQNNKRLVLLTAIACGLLLSVFTIIGHDYSLIEVARRHQFTPLFFSDWIGFIAIAFVLYFYCLPQKRTPLFWASFIITTVFISYHSNNQAIHYGIIIALLVLLTDHIIYYYQKIRLLPALYILLLVGMSLSIIALKVIDHPLLEVLNSSLFSRGNLAWVTIVHYFHSFNFKDLLSVVFGNGYGSFQEFPTQNLYLISDLSLFKGDSWNPSWEYISRNLLHTHNSVIENFCSAGLVGVFAYLFFQYHLIKSAPKRLIPQFYIIILGILTSLWFQFPNTIPFTILALGLVSQKTTFNFSIKVIRPLLLISSPLLIAGGIFHGTMTTNMMKLTIIKKDETFEQRVSNFSGSPWVKVETYTGGWRTVDILKNFFDHNKFYLDKVSKKTSTQIEKQQNFNLYVANTLKIQKIVEELPTNPEMIIIVLNLYNDLFSEPEAAPFLQKNPNLLENWYRLVNRFLIEYPNRFDMSSILLSHLLIHQQTDLMLKTLEKILGKNPQNPLGLWFLGTYQLENPNTAAIGIDNIKTSIKRGLNRFLPLPKEFLQKLQIDP